MVPARWMLFGSAIVLWVAARKVHTSSREDRRGWWKRCGTDRITWFADVPSQPSFWPVSRCCRHSQGQPATSRRLTGARTSSRHRRSQPPRAGRRRLSRWPQAEPLALSGSRAAPLWQPPPRQRPWSGSVREMLPPQSRLDLVRLQGPARVRRRGPILTRTTARPSSAFQRRRLEWPIGGSPHRGDSRAIVPTAPLSSRPSLVASRRRSAATLTRSTGRPSRRTRSLTVPFGRAQLHPHSQTVRRIASLRWCERRRNGEARLSRGRRWRETPRASRARSSTATRP